jgi:hypothetical protein
LVFHPKGRTQVRVFDIEVQRRIFEPETERKEQEDGENYMVRNFINCTFHLLLV